MTSSGMDSRFDKAVWVFLNHPEIWTPSVMFARADAHTSSRSWTKRPGMPVVEPGTSEEHIERLEHALSAYYRERQGRGHHSHIDHFTRGGEQEYYFVYLSDYADTHVNFDDEGKFHRSPDRRAFEIVFAYDRGTGTLDMFAKGGKKVVEPLQQIFSRVILEEDLSPADPSVRPYALDHLMDRGFGFSTDPEDGITAVSMLGMRISLVGNRRDRLVLLPDEEAGPGRIYDMLEGYLNRERLPRSVLHVTKATFQFQFGGNGRRPPEFDVSYPSYCNLKSKREADRLLGEKYLNKFGIVVGWDPEAPLLRNLPGRELAREPRRRQLHEQQTTIH